MQADVSARTYPAPHHTYKIKTAELRKLLGDVEAAPKERRQRKNGGMVRGARAFTASA